MRISKNGKWPSSSSSIVNWIFMWYPLRRFRKSACFQCGTGKWTTKILECCIVAGNAIKALLCNTQCCYGGDSNIQPSNTHDMHCCFTSAIPVMTMHHNVVCTVLFPLLHAHSLWDQTMSSSPTRRWWVQRTAQVNSLSKRNSKHWCTRPSYLKNVNNLQLDSHQITMMDTIPIIHKLFSDKWKGMSVMCFLFVSHSVSFTLFGFQAEY